MTRNELEESMVGHAEEELDLDTYDVTEDEADAEVDLSEALLLLEECGAFIDSLLDRDWNNKLCHFHTKEGKRLGQEVLAFLSAYEFDKVEEGEV